MFPPPPKLFLSYTCSPYCSKAILTFFPSILVPGYTFLFAFSSNCSEPIHTCFFSLPNFSQAISTCCHVINTSFISPPLRLYLHVFYLPNCYQAMPPSSQAMPTCFLPPGSQAIPTCFLLPSCLAIPTCFLPPSSQAIPTCFLPPQTVLRLYLLVSALPVLRLHLLVSFLPVLGLYLLVSSLPVLELYLFVSSLPVFRLYLLVSSFSQLFSGSTYLFPPSLNCSKALPTCFLIPSTVLRLYLLVFSFPQLF